MKRPYLSPGMEVDRFLPEAAILSAQSTGQTSGADMDIVEADEDLW